MEVDWRTGGGQQGAGEKGGLLAWLDKLTGRREAREGKIRYRSGHVSKMIYAIPRPKNGLKAKIA